MALKGTKIVKAVIQPIPSITHSYTIQSTVSANGKLVSPLFVVLIETSEVLGLQVQLTMFKAMNIYATVSTSGKLTKEHFKTWLREVYFPNTNDKIVLLLDSWSRHYRRTLKEATTTNKEIMLFMIPQKLQNIYNRVWISRMEKFCLSFFGHSRSTVL